MKDGSETHQLTVIALSPIKIKDVREKYIDKYMQFFLYLTWRILLKGENCYISAAVVEIGNSNTTRNFS